MSLKRPKAGRRWRRGWPIHAYIGPNGGGKTCAAVWDTIPSLLAGRPVLSTVRILDFENPRVCDDPSCEHPEHDSADLVPVKHMAAHPLWIPWRTWPQLLEVERCDVIADEVTGVASSRDSQSMPSVVANALVQLRRRDVILRWTAPSWARADLIIRECSQAATLCRGSFPVAVPGEGDEERAWRHRRLFRWTTYDAVLLDDLSAGKTEGMKPWTVDYHWGPGSLAFSAYDTFDAVSTLGHVSDHGRCMTCGGRRSVAACSCPDYEGRKRSRGAEPLRGPRVRGAADSPPAALDDTPARVSTLGRDTATVSHITDLSQSEPARAATPLPAPTPEVANSKPEVSDAVTNHRTATV